MTKIKYICKCCGKEYTSYKENSNYCSHDCRIKDNTFYHNCEYCNKEIKVSKSIHIKYISGEKKHLYCSKDCTDKAYTTRVTKICLECGKEFEIGKCFSEIQKFCTRECYNKYRKRMISLQEKTCPICNKVFYTYHNSQKYCSKKCSGISIQKRITCECEICGKKFERIESEVIKNKRHYCSNYCRYEGIRWSVNDIDILRKNYRKIKIQEIQKMLSKHYSIKAIKSRAQDYGFSKSRLWSHEEEKILLENYANIPLNEIMKLLPNRTLSSILGKARKLNLLAYFYLNNVYDVNEIQFLKDNYLIMSDYELAEKLNRTESGISQKLHHLSLYRPIEIKKDGYKDLSNFMRSRLILWKEEVRKNNNYTCCLSGKRSNIVVHHCRSFNLLFDETLEILDFPEYDIFNQYTDEQLLLFVKTFLNLQEFYHAYVCITEEIHKLFHKEYGYGDNTEEQWNDFTNKYENGYYKNIA